MAKKDLKEPVSVDVKHALYVKLTPDEVVDRAKTASELAAEVAKEEESIKADAAIRRSALKKVKARFSAVVAAANDGREYQTVECTQVFDVKKKETWYVYRGETYGKRSMYEHEMREVTQRLFKDEQPLIDGAKGDDGEPIKTKPKKTKDDPKYAVQNVTPIKAANSDVADVMRSETNAKTKKDHST